jgi:hypothetical protein
MEDEVMRALNTLKRAGKIDSVLFFEERDGGVHYLPAIYRVQPQTEIPEYLYYYTPHSEHNRKQLRLENSKEVDNFINQWKMAKIAVAFL